MACAHRLIVPFPVQVSASADCRWMSRPPKRTTFRARGRRPSRRRSHGGVERRPHGYGACGPRRGHAHHQGCQHRTHRHHNRRGPPHPPHVDPHLPVCPPRTCVAQRACASRRGASITNGVVPSRRRAGKSPVTRAKATRSVPTEMHRVALCRRISGSGQRRRPP